MIGFPRWSREPDTVCTVYHSWTISLFHEVRTRKHAIRWLIILAVGLNSVKGCQARGERQADGQPSQPFSLYFLLPSIRHLSPLLRLRPSAFSRTRIMRLTLDIRVARRRHSRNARVSLLRLSVPARTCDCLEIKP